MDADLYKDLYEFELEQRAHLGSIVNIPIIASTALATAAVTMVLGFSYGDSCLTWAFAAAMAAFSAALAFAVYCIFSSLLSYEYMKLPKASDLRKHFLDLKAWHHDEAAAKEDFRQYLNERYAEATDVNNINNQNRGNYIFRANIALAVGMILLAMAGAVYVPAHLMSGDAIYKVRVVP